MEGKNITFIVVMIFLATHFWIKFKVSEPYPALVLPSFSSNGGHTNYYKFSKIDYTFYSTNNDSLTVSPKVVFDELHPPFAGHYTNHLWHRKYSGSAFTEEEEKKLIDYLFNRGALLWNFEKKISHVILRKNQLTYAKDNPTLVRDEATVQQWFIDRPYSN